jgi:mannose-6-phosphate isomerase-like protein (cupin superfamily)
VQVIDGAGEFTPASPNHWVEHFTAADLSVGTYSIPAAGTDDQEPHREDEIYVVTSGSADIETPGGTARVGPGSVVYVPAGERHAFTNIAGDLALLVVFAPAYGSR